LKSFVLEDTAKNEPPGDPSSGSQRCYFLRSLVKP
jgi:hypothetical protein